MNGTGTNKLSLEPQGQDAGGVIVFNQTGILDHASTVPVPNSRLIQKTVLEANATVTVDLTKTYAPNERRLQFSDAIRGVGNIVVNGTDTDPTFANGDITLNEFELGSTGDSDAGIPSNSFSGTLTANDFVNVELRNSLRRRAGDQRKRPLGNGSASRWHRQGDHLRPDPGESRRDAGSGI